MADHQIPRASANQPRRGGWFRRGNSVPAPAVTYHGPAAVWWIPKLRSPRISLWSAAILWLIGLALTAGTMLWAHAESLNIWPFGHKISTPPEVLLRYEMILLVCLVYVTLCSFGVWFRYRRLARRDAVAIDDAIAAERWELAGLLLHRYCLLVSAIWRRVPARVAAWDAIIRPRLPRHRRVYLYYRDQPPPLPTNYAASFSPAVLDPPQPPLWSAAGLIPVAILLYLLMVDILQRGHWQRAILFNAVLLITILVAYGSYFAFTLLGGSRHYRLAPGLLQLMKFPVRGGSPIIETYNLRGMDIIIDLSSRYGGLTLLDTARSRRDTLRLPKGVEAVEAVLRSSLSMAQSPPLSAEHLVD